VKSNFRVCQDHFSVSKNYVWKRKLKRLV
jgi:hypothetical protein